MNPCDNFDCPYRTLYGNCSITACINHSYKELIHYDNNEAIMFPQTIGDITFHSKCELFNWIITQKKMNKDPDFGIGRYS